MYQTSQPMYQGHWQQNYYTGYQPVRSPQYFHYDNNNNYYDNGYNRRVMSSTSSSMDSLNDPYYYSYPATTMPQVQDYRQIPSPELAYYSHPVSPTYSPVPSPSYSPQPPSYSPQPSSYSPQPPTYSSQPPTYSALPSSYPSTMPHMSSNSFYPAQPINYMQTKRTIPTSPSQPKDNQKTGFYIGMKPTERLQWIRETFPKQPLSTKAPTKTPQTPWDLSAAPVKPLRRPHKSTIKK